MMKPIRDLSDEEWLNLVQQAASMPEVPPHLFQQALALWTQARPARPAGPVLAQWLAVLSFDSWATSPLAAGMRALPSDTRQMLFTARGFDIDLRISPEADGFALSGQLFGSGENSARVELALDGIACSGLPKRSVSFDAAGEFRVRSLRQGTCLLTVRLEDEEIMLPPFEIGQLRSASGP